MVNYNNCSKYLLDNGRNLNKCNNCCFNNDILIMKTHDLITRLLSLPITELVSLLKKYPDYRDTIYLYYQILKNIGWFNNDVNITNLNLGLNLLCNNSNEQLLLELINITSKLTYCDLYLPFQNITSKTNSISALELNNTNQFAILVYFKSSSLENTFPTDLNFGSISIKNILNKNSLEYESDPLDPDNTTNPLFNGYLNNNKVSFKTLFSTYIINQSLLPNLIKGDDLSSSGNLPYSTDNWTFDHFYAIQFTNASLVNQSNAAAAAAAAASGAASGAADSEVLSPRYDSFFYFPLFDKGLSISSGTPPPNCFNLENLSNIIHNTKCKVELVEKIHQLNTILNTIFNPPSHTNNSLITPSTSNIPAEGPSGGGGSSGSTSNIPAEGPSGGGGSSG